MSTMVYNVLPGVGPGEFPKEASLRDFVLDIPYLISFDLIPPISVLNDLFSRGIMDAGMSGGCRWDPFTINRDHYDELVKALLALPDRSYKCVEVPDWVRNREDWHIWTMEYIMGVPARKHRELSDEIEKWTTLEKEAHKQGDAELASEYLTRMNTATQKLNDFVMPYIEKYHYRKLKS